MSGNYAIYINLWTWKDGRFGEDCPQVGSTACPEDTQRLLVEKRRNRSRHVDSRPAQKQGVKGCWCSFLFRSKFDNQMFKLEYLKMAFGSSNFEEKYCLDYAEWLLVNGNKTSRAMSITFPTWVNSILTKDSPIRSHHHFQRNSSNGRWLLSKIIPDFTHNLDSPKPIGNKNPTW